MKMENRGQFKRGKDAERNEVIGRERRECCAWAKKEIINKVFMSFTE